MGLKAHQDKRGRLFEEILSVRSHTWIPVLCRTTEEGSKCDEAKQSTLDFKCRKILNAAHKPCDESPSRTDTQRLDAVPKLEAGIAAATPEKASERLAVKSRQEAVELPDRKFSYKHLVQIKYIVPEAVQIDKILLHDKQSQCMKPDFAWDPGATTLNVVGSSSSMGYTGGGVIKKEDGMPILLFTADFGRGSNSEAEFEAALTGLIRTGEEGIVLSEIQTDSKIHADTIAGKIDCPWSCLYYFRRLMPLLNGIRVKHIFQEANSVADRLAAQAHQLGNASSSTISMFDHQVKSAIVLDRMHTMYSRIV